MNNFEYGQPENIDQALQQLDTPGAVLKAGGVDLLDLMKEGIAAPKRLVNVRNLTELKFIEGDSKKGVRIGPSVTLAEIAGSQNLKGSYDCLVQAAEGAATPQIRNMATIGGNICQRPRCWYFRSDDFDCARKGGSVCYAVDGENQYHSIFNNSDGCVIVNPSSMAVALMALDAKIKISNGKDKKQVSVNEFLVAPAKDITKEHILEKGDLITEIELPKMNTNAISFYFKQKEKQACDWPLAEVAVVLEMNGKMCKSARVLLGAAAPLPIRSEAAEKVLTGQTISLGTAKSAAEAALKDATPLSRNAYKVHIFRAVIARSICWAVGIDPLA
jgi:xanthine dehydrogenase YagS FAD-binding subunit